MHGSAGCRKISGRAWVVVMSVDPPNEDGLDKMMEDISKVIQDNKRFLDALKQDRLADDDPEADSDALSIEQEFEEL